jgi:serine/threonine protein kinase
MPTIDPFNPATKRDGYYPYLISEAVENITLTQLATKPLHAIHTLGFNIDTAPPMVLESILLQIIVALKNTYASWGLVHNDLHSGNILLSHHEKADFIVDFKGKKMQLNGPLVKIIDFGLGESKEYRQQFSFIFNMWTKNRPFILELENFISAVLGKEDIPFTTRIAIGQISQNQDIRMFNLLMRALKHKLRKRGSRVLDRHYCKDYDSCIEMVSTWWK